MYACFYFSFNLCNVIPSALFTCYPRNYVPMNEYTFWKANTNLLNRLLGIQQIKIYILSCNSGSRYTCTQKILLLYKRATCENPGWISPQHLLACLKETEWGGSSNETCRIRNGDASLYHVCKILERDVKQ
jgi:hypothetical protein